MKNAGKPVKRVPGSIDRVINYLKQQRDCIGCHSIPRHTRRNSSTSLSEVR